MHGDVTFACKLCNLTIDELTLLGWDFLVQNWINVLR